jgi:hypothetical protein
MTMSELTTAVVPPTEVTVLGDETIRHRIDLVSGELMELCLLLGGGYSYLEAERSITTLRQELDRAIKELTDIEHW